MPYTNIPKPTGDSYTKISKSSIDISVYGSAIYGLNTYGMSNAYTDISKPRFKINAGEYLGFGSFTYASNQSDYINISKPI